MLDPELRPDAATEGSVPEDKILANRNTLAASAAVDELVRCGVRDICLSPGSRSAPLVLAAARDARVATHVHVDERCSGFFALGLSRATRRPVALVCTSGSAAAHFHPAVIEAFETGVPLLVLTADRPPELLDCGAPQTTDQHGLYGSHVLRFQAIGLPRPEAAWLRWLRGRICRFVEIAQGSPSGPVHLDFHFDEPLSELRIEGDVPTELATQDPVAVHGRADGEPFAPWASAELRPSGAALEQLAELVGSRPRGVIVVGPLDANSEEATAIAFLARATGVPVLADPLSGLRRPAAPDVALLGAYDAVLRSEEVAERLKPDWILRLGRTPTSKALVQWMGRHRSAQLIVVDDQGRREDPSHVGALFVRARTAATCGVLGTVLRSSPPSSPEREDWTATWRRLDARAADVLLEGAGQGPPGFEGELIALLASVLPEDCTLLAASSMPIRELDTFLQPGERRLRLLSNRGVNGIDGLVSTAFGIAAGSSGPTLALLGDLALLHDLGGLAAAARLTSKPTILVINNAGGGIFEYLPLAGTNVPMDEFFSTEHAHSFERAADLFGLDYLAPKSPQELADALSDGPGARAQLIELFVDRKASARHHKALWTAASAAALAALEDNGPDA